MKSVLISIRPRWCGLIASGKKTIEIRKSKPRLETPFKAYIYETKTPLRWNKAHNAIVGGEGGRVIGEFVCDRIYQYSTAQNVQGIDITDAEITEASVLTKDQINDYEFSAEARENCIYKIGVYGWHISRFVKYDKGKPLNAFTGLRKTKFGYEPIEIKKAPQSWCYVEELT